MNNKLRLRVISILLCIITILSLCSCNLNKSQPVTKTDFILDTVVSITLYNENASEYIKDCFNLARSYENMLSKTIPDSDVSRINNANGQFVEVSPDTVYLIQQGIYYGDLSDGAFDITIGHLTDIWDIQNRTTPPGENEIASNSNFSYKNIEIVENKVRLLTDKEKLDLGGIAKGYIADKLKEYLLSQGINEGIINLGGNVVCLDKKDGKTDYTIGIQKPFDENGQPICSINVSDKSVVTSGDYQRFFEYEGVKYHHILDVSTGYPVDNDLDSVTIISDSSTAGDALSTIAFTYGLEAGNAFIESLPDTEAIFITKDGGLCRTSGISDNMIKIL